MARRIERLINLIAALLETRVPLTIQQIRDEIAGYEQQTHEAFRRAFERDKADLRALGIPLETRSTGAAGDDQDGYIIPKSRYYLPELELDDDELVALRLAAEALLGEAEEAEAGLLKLSMDEPAGSWSGPRIVWGAHVATRHPLLGAAYSALLERRPIRFTYHSAASGETRPRTVEPYGLAYRRGQWYLVGRDVERNSVRSFRMSRAGGGLETLEGSYDIPEGFDAGAQVAGQAFEIGPDDPATARVRFDASIRWWAEQNLHTTSSHDAGDGALDVELPVANADALVAWVLGFGGGVEILGPPEARHRILEHLAPFLEPDG